MRQLNSHSATFSQLPCLGVYPLLKQLGCAVAGGLVMGMAGGVLNGLLHGHSHDAGYAHGHDHSDLFMYTGECLS